MSVLHHGGSYLQRRLTKMYTDTKTSCESVTTASKAVDDPELVALHRSFRTQRDRLLAWGLDWSDASAAQPNDIDESLTQAGFSDVVESVMSSIQELLNEAERLQHVGAPELPPKGSRDERPTKEGLSTLPVKTHWSNEDIDRSKNVLSDLTACIDTLYDLSRSRRTMTSSSQATRSRQSPTAGSVPVKSKEELYASPFLAKQFEASEKHSKSSFTNPFLIDRSALQLSGSSHDNNPPPYEMVSASTNSRAVGRMKTSASPFLAGTKEPTVPILVEYAPMLETQHAVPVPGSQRLDKVHKTIDQLTQNARVSHLGLLNFLGYCLDRPNSRYAFIYQMPIDYFPFLRNPADLLSELKPKPLVALLQAGDDYQVPNLETRFRLAYDLLMTVLQLRSQNIVHSNINSGNVLIFPGLTTKNDEVRLTEDLRRPYLTSFAQFSGNEPSPEPLSSSMYRHPDDKRSIEDDAGWAYDLYSLGLVLMEIGLWTPISRLWKMKYTNSMFKQRIENVYLQKLAPKCGSAFLHMVQLCIDAPNFHLSTQPFEDLSIRVPQVFHYPVLDLSAPDGIFSFSMNFIYTLSKISWSCCSIDIFSAPAADELDDSLPLALVPETEALAKKAPAIPEREKGPVPPPKLPPREQAPAAFSEVKALREKMGLDAGDQGRKSFKKFTNIEIPQAHLNQWNFQMLPRLRKLLEKVLKDSTESCSVTLMMAGERPEEAKTTVCVTCASAKKVRAALKKYFVLNDDAWDLVVLRGDIQRSKVPRKKRRRPAKARPGREEPSQLGQVDLNPCYQERPLCGASIGAFRNEEHLPPVSYGGAILVDGMPYGMTVHHMLETPSDGEDDEEQDSEGQGNDAPLRSSANWGGEPAHSNATDVMYTWCDEDPSELDLEFEISDDEEGDDFSLSESFDSGFDDYLLSDSYSSDEEDPNEDEDAASIGDTAGIEPGEEPRLFVTQPAIDDVHEGFFPCPEDRDDEHLASHALGFIHASSGVRRWMRRGIKHEIDWALLKINDGRVDARNIVFDKPASRGPSSQQRRRRGEQQGATLGEPIYLNDVARMEDLGGLKVHCCGRTSGLQTGQISRAMTLVKLHGRQSFSTSFCVDGNFGVPGDSGAWVFEKATGRVCGHVLAWSEKNHTAYIAPMEVLLEDIARTLHATFITLPGSPDESVAFAMSQPALAESPSARHRTPLRIPEQLPVDIGRLNIDFEESERGPVRTSSALRGVGTSSPAPAPYRGIPAPMLAQSRGLERQLA